jgi:hypothetical protein
MLLYMMEQDLRVLFHDRIVEGCRKLIHVECPAVLDREMATATTPL